MVISKKDMAVLGLVAVGSVALASKFASVKGEDGFGGGGGLGFGDDEEPEAMTKKETVTYTEPGVVTPPSLPSFKDIFNLPLPETVRISGAPEGGATTGISKKAVTPHPYTGGVVTSGAYTVAPWSAPTPTTSYQYYGGAVKPGAYTVAPWAGFRGRSKKTATSRVKSHRASVKARARTRFGK